LIQSESHSSQSDFLADLFVHGAVLHRLRAIKPAAELFASDE
jgi:hypothetical protein